MKVELVGIAKPDSLVVRSLPALIGEDSEAVAEGFVPSRLPLLDSSD